MTTYEKLAADIRERGDFVAPILPGACWTTVKGNFTSSELRKIAKEIDERFAEVIRGDKDRSI